MSGEMAVSDKGSAEEEINRDEALVASASIVGESSLELPSQMPQVLAEPTTSQPLDDAVAPSELTEESLARKRRASSAFSDPEANEEFRGFDRSNLDDSAVEYNRVLERMEAEITAVSLTFTPVRTITATPPAHGRANKRLRQDATGKSTDGSRPSSALSTRSDGDVASSTDLLLPPPPPVTAIPLLHPSSAASSPANRSARRGTTTEISSPLYRVPLDKGWKRELVYRAALDSHSRRNADIYYYTPAGKKLRSTREVSEQLAGTGLTLDNFSFFKEPLGVDDPEREIIRDAKLQRRVESPVTTPQPQPLLVEGKRQPKPKAPKGASPEHVTTTKSPPLKLKVKSVGSRLSNSGGPSPAQGKQPPKKPAAAAATTTADNNNSATWKKPRLVPPPPPLQCRPALLPPGAHSATLQSPPQVQQPCSISCGGGMVPTLACSACLCLYHPPCVGHSPMHTDAHFLCKNCKKSTSPPLEPPPLVHKSGVPGAGGVPPRPPAPALAAPRPRRPSRPAAAPPAPPRPHKPVLLTMKVSGSDAGGQRVWSVKTPQPAPPPPPALRPALPQSLAIINGKRFIVVPRSVAAHPPRPAAAPAAPAHTLGDSKGASRLSNGAAGGGGGVTSSPRRRGRSKPVDTDYFTDFYDKCKQHKYDVAVQIFQYLGMRDLAHCARVCKLWRELVDTPLLWRHVRMKNSHVSEWGGLSASLRRHGTTRLDLRKMLLPQNDTLFWESFAHHIPTVDTLERIEMCRCPASAVEAVCRGLPGLRALSALAVRDARFDPTPLACLPHLRELRLKSMAGLSLTRDLTPLAKLTELQHLSLTSIKELGLCACEIVGSLKNLISLELGECTFRASFGAVLSGLKRLQRLRLERGTAECAAPALLRALALLPELQQLELVNFDVKVGFDDALAECKNIQRLLIIPTYVSQSATTNKQVLSGVLRLKDTLTHLMWGVTIELLRVTELFIDQCDQAGDSKKKDIGECIPVLKPVPGCKLPDEHHVSGPPQVEILPLPTLQRLLSAQLPNTKLKLLRIPFHATWRQTLADFQ